MLRFTRVLLLCMAYSCCCLLARADLSALEPIQNAHRVLVSLDGIWRFRPDYTNEGIDRSWCSLAHLPEPYLPIAVPASYNDLHQAETLRRHRGFVWYQRSLSIPVTLLSSRLLLHFASVHYSARVWLDDREVPALAHVGGHIPFEAELWDGKRGLLSRGAGVYRLTVCVDSRLNERSLPPDGKHPELKPFNYAGIERSVLLYSTPSTYISDVVISTVSVSFSNGPTFFSHGYAPAHRSCFHLHSEEAARAVAQSAELNFAIDTRGSSSGIHTMLELLDADDKVVASSSAGSGRLTVTQPQLWLPCGMAHTHNCTTPAYVYTARVRIMAQGDGEILDEYSIDSIGIRTVDVSGTRFLVNGAPFYFHGVNRHEDSYIHGNGADTSLLVKDISLMQWLHSNALRSAHYPHDSAWYTQADKFGLAIIDELPAYNMHKKEYFNEYTLAQHKRVALELFARDKNHPSFLLLSLFSEPLLHGSDDIAPYFEEIADYVRYVARSAPRPITFVNNKPATDAGNVLWHLFDVTTANLYFGWREEMGHLERIPELLTEELRNWQDTFPDKPFLLTEFGAETLPGLHTDPPQPYSEEYQAECYRQHYSTLDEFHNFVIGELPWSADFITEDTIHRVDSRNNKGLFTRDRQPKAAAMVVRERFAHLESAGSSKCCRLERSE